MRVEEYPVEAALATGTGEQATAAQDGHRSEGPPDPVPQALLQEARLLQGFGIGKPLLGQMMAAAARHGTSIEQELLASGEICETVYYEALAERLDLPFAERIDPARVHDVTGLDTQLLRPEILRCHHPVRPPRTFIVPSLATSAALDARMRAMPDLKASLGITTPTALRRAVWQAGASRRLRDTIGRLFEHDRDSSARIVLAGPQGFVIGLILAVLLACLATSPGELQLTLHLALSLFYLSHLLLRLSALPALRRARARRPRLRWPCAMIACRSTR